jgi:hypothetical protein
MIQVGRLTAERHYRAETSDKKAAVSLSVPKPGELLCRLAISILLENATNVCHMGAGGASSSDCSNRAAACRKILTVLVTTNVIFPPVPFTKPQNDSISPRRSQVGFVNSMCFPSQ